jgi:hypothetical protein
VSATIAGTAIAKARFYPAAKNHHIKWPADSDAFPRARETYNGPIAIPILWPAGVTITPGNDMFELITTGLIKRDPTYLGSNNPGQVMAGITSAGFVYAPYAYIPYDDKYSYNCVSLDYGTIYTPNSPITQRHNTVEWLKVLHVIGVTGIASGTPTWMYPTGLAASKFSLCSDAFGFQENHFGLSASWKYQNYHAETLAGTHPGGAGTATAHLPFTKWLDTQGNYVDSDTATGMSGVSVSQNVEAATMFDALFGQYGMTSSMLSNNFSAHPYVGKWSWYIYYPISDEWTCPGSINAYLTWYDYDGLYPNETGRTNGDEQGIMECNANCHGEWMVGSIEPLLVTAENGWLTVSAPREITYDSTSSGITPGVATRMSLDPSPESWISSLSKTFDKGDALVQIAGISHPQSRLAVGDLSGESDFSVTTFCYDGTQIGSSVGNLAYACNSESLLLSICPGVTQTIQLSVGVAPYGRRYATAMSYNGDVREDTTIGTERFMTPIAQLLDVACTADTVKGTYHHGSGSGGSTSFSHTLTAMPQNTAPGPDAYSIIFTGAVRQVNFMGGVYRFPRIKGTRI